MQLQKLLKGPHDYDKLKRIGHLVRRLESRVPPSLRADWRLAGKNAEDAEAQRTLRILPLARNIGVDEDKPLKRFLILRWHSDPQAEAWGE